MDGDPNILPLLPPLPPISFDHETQVLAPPNHMKDNFVVPPLLPTTLTPKFVSIVHQRCKTNPIVYSLLLPNIVHESCTSQIVQHIESQV